MAYEDKSKYKVEYIGEKFSKGLTSYKVIVIGRYDVGKTTIINKMMQKVNDKEYTPTMSIDIKNIQFKVNDAIMQINIWDCCSNDKFALNTPNLFKNASIAILVYSINDIISFNDLEIWHNMLKEYSKDSIIFLIGNKNNIDKEREVTIEQAEKFKNNNDDIKMFFETSALDCDNIDKLLDNIAISIYEKDKMLEYKEERTITIVKEDLTKKGEKKKKRYC